MIGWQTQPFKPFHEVGREHLAFAVKCITAQPRAFAATKGKGAHVIKLLTQFALVNQIRQRDVFGTVDQAKRDLCVRLVSKDALTHQ